MSDFTHYHQAAIVNQSLFSDKTDIIVSNDTCINHLRDIVSNLANKLESVRPHDGSQLKAADQSVELLFRICENYWKCIESRPSERELWGYITYAMDCVDKALGQAQAHQKMDEGDTSITRLRKNSLELSKGTLERQLCGLVPTELLSNRKFNSSASSTGPKMFQYRPMSVYSQKLTRRMRCVSKPPATHPHQSAVYTHPLNSPEIDQNAISVETVSTSSSLPLYEHVNLSKTSEVEWFRNMSWRRDEWICDFCGPECFCYYIRD